MAEFSDIVIKVQRTENCLAVKWDPKNVQVNQLIHGWSGLPFEEEINLPEDAWIVQRSDGQLFVVDDEGFNRDFVKVLDV